MRPRGAREGSEAALLLVPTGVALLTTPAVLGDRACRCATYCHRNDVWEVWEVFTDNFYYLVLPRAGIGINKYLDYPSGHCTRLGSRSSFISTNSLEHRPVQVHDHRVFNIFVDLGRGVSAT